MLKEWPGFFRQLDQCIIDNILSLNATSSEEEWMNCLASLEGRDGFVSNDETDTTFPSKRWTFLHHAARYNAPKSVIEKMREDRYVLSLKDSEGKMAIEHVSEDATDDYYDLFEPKYKLDFNMDKLAKIEKHFHEVILSRSEREVKQHNLILPMITVLLETVTEEIEFWFAVPGMYGGFTMGLTFNDDKTDVVSLQTSSWCRVAGGSGQTHKCTEDGWTLEAEGFV